MAYQVLIGMGWIVVLVGVFAVIYEPARAG